MTMNDVDLKLAFEQKETSYLIEQGIPVFPMEPAAIANLRLIDENNNSHTGKY